MENKPIYKTDAGYIGITIVLLAIAYLLIQREDEKSGDDTSITTLSSPIDSGKLDFDFSNLGDK